MNFKSKTSIVWCKIMKITCIQLFIAIVFSVFALANTGHAQNILNKRVDIVANQLNLNNFLKKLERKTGVKFVYLQNIINDKESITIDLKDEKLENILKLLSKSYHIKYEVVNDRIILNKVSDRSSLAEKEVLSDREVLQEVIVKGNVTDASGQPIAGVAVRMKGTKIATSTDNMGNYTLTIPDYTGTMEFAFVGFVTTEVAINGRKIINVQLAEENKDLNEVVVVGYGTQKKVNLTGSVSSISAKEIENRPLTQASQALAGLASGVTVSQSGGRPGGDGANINIRGLGTFSGAGNSPLILVDGLAASLNDVDPNNIKSISILKDAASASIYGTRAANGVILIETKRGSAGKMQVSYNNYIGWQKVTELPDFLESADYATYRNEASANASQAAPYSAADIEKFRTGSDPDNFPNVPHLKNLLSSGSGFQTNHNLNFAGGNEKNSYFFSLGYLDQDGIVAKNNYYKYNILSNFDSKIKDNLTLKVNLSANASSLSEPRQSSGDMQSIIRFAVREGPVFAGKKSDGTYGYQDNFSPEAWLSSSSFTKNLNKYFLGSTELLWDVFKDFTLSGKAGYNYTNYNNKAYASDFVFNAGKTVGPNNLTVVNGSSALLTLQALANYRKTLEKHDIGILAGYSQEEYNDEFLRGYRQNFPNNLLYTLNAGAPTGMQAYNSGSEWALRSYFGRINYAFDGKYLFEANLRYDGTSRFPSAGRWGLFPSVSAGWRVSEESFIKNKLEWIDNLKLRASWGKLGNQNINNYPYQNTLVVDGQGYPFGGVLNSGTNQLVLANSAITWEKTAVTDLGLDLSIFKGKLGLVVDYFDKRTTDILSNISVSQVLGLAPAQINAGEVRNKGIEVQLNYQQSIGAVKLGFIPNFSYVDNKVVKLVSGLQNDIASGLFVGQSLGAIYGYVADGLFRDAADVSGYPTQPYAAEPGLVRYKDINGPNGLPDGKVDATYDRKVIGSTLPKYTFGATITADYKNFDFSLMIQGLGGLDKQMGAYQASAFYNGGQIQQWQVDNRWTTENPNPNALYPKLTSLNQGSGTIQTSTFWNRNGSFLRVKNIQIGYALPTELLSKLHVSRARIFFSGQNLLTLSSFYKGWDPEMYQGNNSNIYAPLTGSIGIGDNSPFYPITSVYTFGINVKF